MSEFRTSYHEHSFDLKLRKESIENTVRAVSQFSQSVGLAFTGISGMSIGFAVADRTGREFIVIRKDGDSHNAFRKVEGYHCDEYVIVDDFIASGDTVKRIISMMMEHCPGSKCVGIVLYDDSRKDYFSTTIEGTEINPPVLSRKNKYTLPVPSVTQ